MKTKYKYMKRFDFNLFKKFYVGVSLLFSLYSLQAQVLWTEDFESGGGNWTLNSGDMGTIGPSTVENQWIINNKYQGGIYNFMGFPISVSNTPTQPAAITNAPTSYYMHIVYPDAASQGIDNANYVDGNSISFAGGNGGAHFAKMNVDINTTGFTGVTLEFYYIDAGGTSKVYYSTDGGNTWQVPTGGTLSHVSNWTLKTITDPAFDNKPTLRFAFYFDDFGNPAQDPPLSVDQIKVYVPTTSTLNADFTASQTNICVGQCINFTDQSTGNPTSWNWTFAGATPGSSTQQNPTNICYNTPGDYTVTLTVGNGSSTDTETKTAYIHVNPAPTVTITASQTQICPGQQATLTASGASTYTWNNGLGNANPVQVSPASTTTYSVTGTDVNGCSNTASVTITVTSTIQVTIDTMLCPGETITIGGHTFNSPGTYSDTVTSSGGCDSITTIHIAQGASPDVILPADTVACMGQTVTIVPIVIGTYYSAVWSDGVTTLPRTVADSGYYSVSVANACGSDMATIHVHTIECGGELYFPNVFTPNGDPYNQYFSPIGTNVYNYELYIYNRWGNLLFKTSDVNQPWDGKYKGVDVAEGVYFYVAKYEVQNPTTLKMEKKIARGSITVIR
jgi:gliding motility-associated-like protein